MSKAEEMMVLDTMTSEALDRYVDFVIHMKQQTAQMMGVPPEEIDRLEVEREVREALTVLRLPSK